MKVPTPTPANVPVSLVGVYRGLDLKDDFFEEVNGQPGVQLVNGAAQPADGGVAGVGQFRLSLSAAGGLAEEEWTLFGSRLREATVDQWSSALSSGDARFINGPGLWSDERGRARLTATGVGLTVETSRTVIDNSDLDRDGSRVDAVIVRRRIRYLGP